jgi:LacI family transcriptional regulator
VTNIKDVARLCEVSVATVSKVVNGYPNVAPKTREKVLRVIKETKFFPNSVARGLVKGRSMALGIFLTTGMSHPYFSSVLMGMEQSLKVSGYDLIYMAQVSWDDSEYSFVRHCMSRNVDGVVVFGFQRDDMNLDELIKEEMPTIFVDMDMVGKRAGYVCSDNRQGIRMGMDYLYQLGHRKIAFISGYLESFVGKTRFEGYRSGLQDYSLPYINEYVKTGDFSKEKGYESMKELLQCSNLPTAVICSSDMSAIGAIEAIREAGLSVPEDISIIGFDDIPLSEYVIPAITTIRQNKEFIGQEAVTQLIAMIDNVNYSPPSVEVPTELIIRDSCRAI